ncbi:MAG: signal recognition particle receptor subunit alpha, partial [Gaiellaceae bacterium]
MARSWAELLGDEDAAADDAERASLFTRLRDSLGKSRRALTEELALGSFDPAEEASWERLEEALIAADVGVPATAELVQRLEARGDVPDLGAALEEEIARMLGTPERL